MQRKIHANQAMWDDLKKAIFPFMFGTIGAIFD